MLVLTRHRNDSIMIGSDIEIKIIDIRGDKVRLGFIAPDGVQILRKELLDGVRCKNIESAKIQLDDMPS